LYIPSTTDRNGCFPGTAQGVIMSHTWQFLARQQTSRLSSRLM